MKIETQRLFKAIAKVDKDSVHPVRPYQFYQVVHYESRIQPVYEARLKTAEEAAGSALPKAEQMSLRQQVIKEFWDAESDEEKERIEELAEADFKRRQAECGGDLPIPKTPEDYEEYVDCS